MQREKNTHIFTVSKWSNVSMLTQSVFLPALSKITFFQNSFCLFYSPFYYYMFVYVGRWVYGCVCRYMCVCSLLSPSRMEAPLEQGFLSH